jgi:hypothetical protein
MEQLRSIEKKWGKARTSKPPPALFGPFLIAFWAVLLIFGTQSAPGSQRQILRGHVPGAVRGSLVAVEALPASTRLKLSIGLPLRNAESLTNLLAQLYDPADPLYHRYLTPQEFADRFGPTEQEYQALIGFVQSKSLVVTGRHSNRLILDVEGAVSDIETAFATKLNVYAHPTENRKFFAPAVEPSVEAGFAILDISGLDNYLLPQPSSLRPVPASRPGVPNFGSAPGGSYRGNDFRAAYLPGVALSGSGQIVGLLEFDGYYLNDITTYESAAGLPNVPLQNVLLNGSNGSPGANNAEVALDIEMTICVAPGLSSVLVYEGSSANTVLNRMATDNRAKQLSSSWTFGINATTENIFHQFAAQGQSLFQASGDTGAYSGPIPTPSDDPNVTVVGGTTLSTSGSGGAYVSETTWNWALTGGGTNASSGGVSTTYAIPSYQKGIDMGNNQGSTTQRNIPDVAMAADNIWVVWDNGSTGTFGGTSASTPLWAGFMALVNQQAVANGHATVGFVNPALYTIAKGTNYSSCFHDITTGNNMNSGSGSKFIAVTGYDLCTGWGTPAGQPLINALAGGTNLAPSFNKNPFVVATANVGQLYSGSISNQASDPNPADPLTFAKLSGPAWLNVASDGSLSGTPANANVGTNAFTVSVTESAGMSNTATMYLNVNGAPTFTSSTFTEPIASVGQPYSQSIASQAADPNPGDTLTFSKSMGPGWLSVSPAGVISGTPTQTDVGANAFTIIVTDTGGLTANATMYISVNGPPTFAANPFTALAVSVGQTYSGSITNQAADPNPGVSLTFAKLSGPAWLVVAPDGSLFGTPGTGDVGTNTFNVSVTDSGGLTANAVMHIPVMPAPTGPSLQVSRQTGVLILSWTGGTPPFQPQISTNLTSGTWQNLGGLVTNYTLTVNPGARAAVFRVQSGVP